MRQINLEIFDEIVTGTGTTWYTSSDHHAALGGADGLIVQACTSLISGSSPTLTVAAEHSADGRAFVALEATPQINGSAVTEGGVYVGRTLFPASGQTALAFVRLAVTLGGTTPQCRLKLAVTGRST